MSPLALKAAAVLALMVGVAVLNVFAKKKDAEGLRRRATSRRTRIERA